MKVSLWRQLYHASVDNYFSNQNWLDQKLHSLQVLFICCGRGKNLCSRGCWWSVISCIARGVTGKMVVSRSRSTIWLGLPGERHLERSFRLQAAWQSLPEMLQVTGGQGGEKLWRCGAFLFPFFFQKPSTWSSCSNCKCSPGLRLQ